MENRRTATNTRENRELNRGYFSGVCDEICIDLERRDIRIWRIVGRLQTDVKTEN